MRLFYGVLVIAATQISQCWNQGLSCSSASSCGECVAMSPDCAWCSAINYENRPRCELVDVIRKTCPEESLFDPTNSLEVLDDGRTSDSKATLQVSPKRVHYHLRPNSPARFTVRVEQTSNYPVDLYYLMDLTISMKDHKETLAVLAEQLGQEMANITGNFRLGFGSFIDKVAMPYASMLPEKLANPCSDGLDCVPPYGFKNHLPLTENATEFAAQVRAAKLSANLDNAEGGFDALMQVLVCSDAIAWSEDHRRIVIFASDSKFHYAGDGLLGGIIAPNDGRCHLNREGYYEATLKQDYPSVSQISSKISESKANIIFAVPTERIGEYNKLSSAIGNSVTGEMSADSSNIIELIRENYKRIASRIELIDDSPAFIETKYFSRCDGNTMSETNYCERFRVGDVIEFEVEVTVNGCPRIRDDLIKLVISPVGLRDAITVELNVTCSCPCESKPEMESGMCSRSGDLLCGQCSCLPNHFGKNCECDGSSDVATQLMDSCKRPLYDGSMSTSVCSHRGDCTCGQCECHSPPDQHDAIFGRYCECDTFSCERDPRTNLTCGGLSHGQCCDGHCTCYPGWSGPACDCTQDVSTCDAPNGKLCSGNGHCECGKCKCANNEANIYTGVFCEVCLTCEGRCSDVEDCLRCKYPDLSKAQMSANESEACVTRCANYHFKFVDQFEEFAPREDGNTTQTPKHCIFTDAQGCHLSFEYVYDYFDDHERARVKVLRERECPEAVNLLYVLGWTTLAVFLVGILIVLIFRYIMYVKDKRDYAKWLAEVEETKEKKLKNVGTNPIYKEASTNYQNPLYGGN